jgi:hypothetical protein
MEFKKPAYYDLETVALLRATLDDAWDSIGPEQQIGLLKSALAERILKSAAEGERDAERLRIAVKSHPTPTPFRVQFRPPQVGLERAYPCSA